MNIKQEIKIVKMSSMIKVIKHRMRKQRKEDFIKNKLPQQFNIKTALPLLVFAFSYVFFFCSFQLVDDRRVLIFRYDKSATNIFLFNTINVPVIIMLYGVCLGRSYHLRQNYSLQKWALGIKLANRRAQIQYIKQNKFDNTIIFDKQIRMC